MKKDKSVGVDEISDKNKLLSDLKKELDRVVREKFDIEMENLDILNDMEKGKKRLSELRSSISDQSVLAEQEQRKIITGFSKKHRELEESIKTLEVRRSEVKAQTGVFEERLLTVSSEISKKNLELENLEDKIRLLNGDVKLRDDYFQKKKSECLELDSNVKELEGVLTGLRIELENEKLKIEEAKESLLRVISRENKVEFNAKRIIELYKKAGIEITI